jgi:hypothetical protein
MSVTSRAAEQQGKFVRIPLIFPAFFAAPPQAKVRIARALGDPVANGPRPVA